MHDPLFHCHNILSKKTLSLILLNKKKFIQIELLVAELLNFENWYKKQMENSKREYLFLLVGKMEDQL